MESESSMSAVSLPDGTRLVYEILGSEHLRKATPIVLVCGMSSLRGDWHRLSSMLQKKRPVLLYDHRGMGDSCPAVDDDISIELLARDLHFLLSHVGWQEIAVCGYSMGGVIAQQLVLLPYHPTLPTPLGFRVTHLLLACTRSTVMPNAGLHYSPPPASDKPRTPAERMEAAKRVLQQAFDPAWLAKNPERFKTVLDRAVRGSHRPPAMIVKQGIAGKNFDFGNLFDCLSKDMRVLVIHGRLDGIIPFESSQDILKRISWAQPLKLGRKPGQVPSLSFGHQWYEYFDIEVWTRVVDTFLEKKQSKASTSGPFRRLLLGHLKRF